MHLLKISSKVIIFFAREVKKKTVSQRELAGKSQPMKNELKINQESRKFVAITHRKTKKKLFIAAVRV